MPPRKPPSGDVVDDLVDRVIYQYLDLPKTRTLEMVIPPPLSPSDELRLMDKFLIPDSWLPAEPQLLRAPLERVLLRLIATPEARFEHLLRLSREGYRFEGDTDMEAVLEFVAYGPYSPHTHADTLFDFIRDPAALTSAAAAIGMVIEGRIHAEFDWCGELVMARRPFKKGDQDDLIADKLYDIASTVYPTNRSCRADTTTKGGDGGAQN